MKRSSKKHPIRTLVALLALAALCVGFAELAVCRVEDPALYERITAPARDACQDVRARIERRVAQRQAQREARLAEREARRLAEEEAARLAEEEAARAQELAAQVASAPLISEPIVYADPTITEFVAESGREVLTGGNVTLYYYNQGDEAWAEQLFGSDPIGRYGCGPTVMAMVAASMSEEADATPASVAAWAARAGYWAPRSGSYLSLVQGTAGHYGLSCASLGAIDADALYRTLSAGGVVVALMGPGHFTGGGHFILLHGVTLSGGILVADPSSRDNSLAVWDAQTIVDELSKSRHDGAPLWLITKSYDQDHIA